MRAGRDIFVQRSQVTNRMGILLLLLLLLLLSFVVNIIVRVTRGSP